MAISALGSRAANAFDPDAAARRGRRRWCGASAAARAERRPASSSSRALPVPGTAVRSVRFRVPAGPEDRHCLTGVPWPGPRGQRSGCARRGSRAPDTGRTCCSPSGGSGGRAVGAASIRASREGPRAACEQSAVGRGRNWSAERSAGVRRNTVGGEPGSGRGGQVRKLRGPSRRSRPRGRGGGRSRRARDDAADGVPRLAAVVAQVDQPGAVCAGRGAGERSRR